MATAISVTYVAIKDTIPEMKREYTDYTSYPSSKRKNTTLLANQRKNAKRTVGSAKGFYFDSDVVLVEN